jgi:hypothetical protein
MSANNELVICEVVGVYGVFENGCVDNDFERPTSLEGALFVTKNLSEAHDYAERYCIENIVEYGIRTDVGKKPDYEIRLARGQEVIILRKDHPEQDSILVSYKTDKLETQKVW